MNLVFRTHAIRRMFQRRISVREVRQVVSSGEKIEDYPDDRPYPSRLVLGWVGNRPLHVVLADNRQASEIVVITVYEPIPERWEAGLRRRKR